jgi:hypothetical protein
MDLPPGTVVLVESTNEPTRSHRWLVFTRRRVFTLPASCSQQARQAMKRRSLSLRKRATRPRSSACSRLARLPTATATAWTCGPRSTMPHGTTSSTQPRCSWRTTPTCTLAARTSEPREPRRRSQGALGARRRRARSHQVPGHHVLFCGRIRRQRRRSPGSLGAGLLVHGADVHARNKDGCTPLAEAKLFDSREMKALLQQHGAK